MAYFDGFWGAEFEAFFLTKGCKHTPRHRSLTVVVMKRSIMASCHQFYLNCWTVIKTRQSVSHSTARFTGRLSIRFRFSVFGRGKIDKHPWAVNVTNQGMQQMLLAHINIPRGNENISIHDPHVETCQLRLRLSVCELPIVIDIDTTVYINLCLYSWSLNAVSLGVSLRQ